MRYGIVRCKVSDVEKVILKKRNDKERNDAEKLAVHTVRSGDIQ